MMVPDRLAYWLKGDRTQNFGDYLGEFILKSLFVAFDEGPKLHLSGSVIDDGMIPLVDDPIDPSQPRVSFWGCGIRTRGGLLRANRAHIEFFAVRGPVSASDLRLGNSVPFGDPGLLLPALYKPRVATQFRGKAVCIPHINDERSDEDLLSLAAGDVILRSSILDNHDAFLAFIDSVASAGFVLSASLHGAVVAAAYGRPFAFWDNGHLDLPTKWEDFASYANFETHGIRTISDAITYYESKIAPTLAIPSLWPLLANAPCQIKPTALLKVLQYELMREGDIEASKALDSKIESFLANPEHFDRLAERTRRYSRKRLESVTDSLAEKEAQLNALKALIAQEVQEGQKRLGELNRRLDEERRHTARKEADHEKRLIALSAELGTSNARTTELSVVIENLNARAQGSEQALQKREKQLEEFTQDFDAERMSFKQREVEHEAQVAALSSKFSTLTALTTEQSLVIENLNARAQGSEQGLHESQQRLEEVTKCLDDERINVKGREVEHETRLATLSSELGTLNARATEQSLMIEKLDTRARESEQSLQESQRQLNEVGHCLGQERINFASKEIGYESRLSQLSAELDMSKARTRELSQTFENLSARALDSERDLQGTKKRLDEARRYLDRERVIFARKEVGYEGRLAALSSELALSKEANADASSHFDRGRVANAELTNLLADCRAQIDSLRVTLSSNETDLLLQRRAKAALDFRIYRLEREMVTRVLRVIGRQSLFERVSGRATGARRALADQTRRIADYVTTFDASRIMAPGERDRGARIVQFLLSASDSIADLPFFDVPTYVGMYRESIPAGTNPLIHYLSCGPGDKQRPHILFDTEYYLTKYPGSATMSIDAFAHYVRWGADKGYNPHPLFDTQYYLSRCPDVAISRVNPLVHYLMYPGCHPHPLFDTEYYLKQSPEVAGSGQNPLAHYLTEGAESGLDPHPWFSSRFYLDGYHDVAAAGVNPLVHYLTFGAREGRNPHPAFSTNAYLDSHPELRKSGENPLIHFLTETKTGGPIPMLSLPIPQSVHDDESLESPAPRRRRVVLMIDACYPRPDKDSGSLDQVAFVRIFQNLGYEVTFAADLELGVETPYRDKMESMQVKCLTYPEYQSIDEYLRRHADKVAICFLSRVHFGTRHIQAIRQLCPEALVIYNTVDLHHVREQRQAALNSDSEGLARARDTYVAEAAATRDSDATILVSDREATYWKTELPDAAIYVVPLIRDYKVGRMGSFGDRSSIAFIGGFKHLPNVDAVTHFLDDIWPLVRTSLPDVVFHVIGPDLPDSLSTRSDAGVKFVGHVEDLEGYLAGIRLTVAPLRYGSGAKGKIVSSLACGVPCVASPIASEGMGLADGVNVLVGDSSIAFADKVVGVYRDQVLWSVLSDNGMRMIAEHHSIEHGVDLVRSIVQSVVSRKLTPSSEALPASSN